MGQQGSLCCVLRNNERQTDAGHYRTRFTFGWRKGGVTMNTPDEKAMDAITDCFCNIFRAGKGGIGCLDCPLHKIKSEYGGPICSLYCSDYDKDRIALLQACVKHGNVEIFKNLSPEYRQFVIGKATVV